MPEFNMNMQVSVQLPRNWRELEAKIRLATEIAARHVEGDSKARIAGTYSQSDRAVDTGTTMNTINARPDGFGGLSWKIGPSTEYAPFIEYGTERMRARPFMIPAAEKERPRIEKAITELFKDL